MILDFPYCLFAVGLCFLCYCLLEYSLKLSKQYRKNTDYAKKVGFLYNDVLKGKDTVISSFMHGQPRAYSAYHALDQYKNGLQATHKMYSIIEKFLNHFKVESQRYGDVTVMWSISPTTVAKESSIEDMANLSNQLKGFFND